MRKSVDVRRKGSDQQTLFNFYIKTNTCKIVYVFHPMTYFPALMKVVLNLPNILCKYENEYDEHAVQMYH